MTHRPVLAGQGKGLLQHLRIAGAVNNNVGRLALEDARDFKREIGLGGIDDMGGAVGGGLLQFMGVKIHGDYRVGSGKAGAQHHAQPNAAATDDDQRLADFDFGIIGNDAETGGERVGQQGANLEIRARRGRR